MKRPFWYRLRSRIESNPYSWYLAWKLFHSLPYFLPHDKIYLAIRHFNLSPGDLIMDVGANDGISAISFYHIYPRVKVFSIEPNDIHGSALARLKRRHPSFNYRIIGAGSDRRSLTLYTPRYHSIYLHTFTSSDEIQVRKAVIESFGEQVGNRIEMIITKSEIIPLDELALAPEIIKIDVEGYEYPVLQGLQNTLLTHRPFLILESCHSDGDEIIKLLKKLNYAVLDYDYKQDTFQELDASLGNVNVNRNNIVVPVEKLSTLPFHPPER